METTGSRGLLHDVLEDTLTTKCPSKFSEKRDQ